jgi:hypothetical protein
MSAASGLIDLANPAPASLASGSMPMPRGGFEHRHAAHCESGVMANLLQHHGVPMTESLAFGLASALSFAYLPFIKIGGLPLIAYRMPPKSIIKGLMAPLQARFRFETFRSPAAGEARLDALLDEGRIVGLQTSVYWLPYFPPDMRFQFNAHNLVAYGKRDQDYLISDPVAEHPVTCPAPDLKRARFAKGIFAPKGLIYYPVFVPRDPDLAGAVRVALRHTAKRMLDIPMPFLGVRGIRSLAKQMERWPDKHGPERATVWVGSVVRMQEEIGTGGAGFRFMYSAFLQEASELLKLPALSEAARQMTETGDRWREFAVQGALLCKGHEQGAQVYRELADRLRDCADREERIFRLIQQALS